MRKLIQSTLLLVSIVASTPAFAATATDFYVSLLRRGTADVEAGRNAEAVTVLRLAAFGLVDSIPEYETALAYLAVAHDRLKEQDRVRDTAVRILSAERIERRFAGLSLPSTIRAAFEAAARKVLSSAEVATLTAPVPAPATVTPPRNEPASRPTESTSRPVVESPSKPATTTTTTPSTNTSSTTRRPEDSTSAVQPKPEPPKPAPAKPQSQPQTTTQPARPAVVDVNARLAAGERALLAANLVDARRIYRELLEQPNLEHGTWIRVAEGLYRSRDFANTLVAFQRAGTLRPGEEAYRYYIAVAHYETGQFDRAKRELAAALPHIELTPDVQRYRAKIEGAR
jgi:tetratricopeptide (TPR) repeat protein